LFGIIIQSKLAFQSDFLPLKKSLSATFLKTSPKISGEFSFIRLEIHREFETASEKLLESAKEIINSQPKVNVSKIQQLKNLGFKQVQEVEQGNKVLEKTELSKEQIDLVNYYSHNYPFNKFITEEQVKTICHKYNLVCGDVERFKGFVPEKNLSEIVNFKLKEKDNNFIVTSNGLIFENAETRLIRGYTHIYKKTDPSEFNYAFQSNDGINFYSKDNKNIFGLSHLGDQKFTIENKSLKICAPVKDMDISGLELKEGYKLIKKIEIPDPVVLQPVKGGYLILTAWGDEASDPLVVNQNHN